MNILSHFLLALVLLLFLAGIAYICILILNYIENIKYRKKYIDNIHDDFDFNDYNDKYNIYIQPFISKHSFSQAGEPQLLRDYFIKKVFIKRTEEPRVFCILGDTGSGKTAALVHLYHDYIKSHTQKNLPYDIKFVSLRRNNAFQTIEEIKEKRKCILLLDAIDENQKAQEPKDSEKYKSFIQQLEKTYDNFAFVVTTCRPQFFANESEEFDITEIPTANSWLKVTKLYLLPFNDKQISEYFDKLFSFRSDNELRHKAEVLIHKYPFITTRPLVLTYIREIVESNRNIDTTLDLYDAIVNNSIRRDLNKILPQINNKDIMSWWIVLSEVASYLYSHKKNRLSSEELQSIISKSTNTNDIIKNYFQQRSLLTRTGNEFHFSHKSFYEYFMAYRFLQHPEEIKQIDGMDFALQIYDNAYQAWSDKKDTPFADLKNTDPYTVASSLNNVGYALYDINHFTQAEFYYQRALVLYRKLEEKNPDRYRGNIALVLYNLANLHSVTDHLQVAEMEYTEALAIYRQLADENPKEFRPNVAKTLNCLANLHLRTKKLTYAEDEYTESIGIYRKYNESNPNSYLPEIASSLNKLASIYSKSNYDNDLLFAESKYKEAYNKYYVLAKEDNSYLPDVAMTLNNLAVLHNDTNQLDKAEEEYNEALTTYRQLADKNPDAYLPYVAGTLNNLAVLHNDTNQLDKAEEKYNEALTTYRQLADKNPDAYLPDLAMTLNNLAILHKNTNQLDKAEEEYNEALTTYRQLAAQNPDAYLPDVAMTLNNLAALHSDTNQLDKAEEEYNEALTTYRQLADKNPDAYLTDVAMTLNNLTALHYSTNQYKEAEEEYNEVLNTYRKLADKNPDAYLPYVATTLNNLATLHQNTNQLDKAEEEYNEALTIRRQLADKTPDAYLPDVAQTLNNLAVLHNDTNQLDKAEEKYNEALTTYRQLADKNPDAYLTDVAMTLNNLTALHYSTNQYK